MRFRFLLAAFPLAALGLGCSSSEESADGDALPTELPAECASLIDQCLVNQQTCVAPGGTPECSPCPTGRYASRDTGLCAEIPGTKLEHSFPTNRTEPGEEIKGVCRSWTLGNESDIWVNAVELRQDEASHHSNWMFVPDDEFDGPDGFWPCEERGYSQLQAALVGGVLYAQSTQATKEVQRFPDGVAVRIPRKSRIISDVHVLNTTMEPVEGNIELAIYSLPEDEVTVKLAPFHLSYEALDIPPRATSRFTGVCELDSEVRKVTGEPLSAEIYYTLPHTHELGSRFFLEAVGGAADGMSIIDIKGFNSEARGRSYDPPLDMAGLSSFRFGCEFTNPRDERVGWGFGDQEMCEVLGFWRADVAFESFASTTEPVGTDGNTQLYTNPEECDTFVFNWSQTKPGGE